MSNENKANLKDIPLNKDANNAFKTYWVKLPMFKAEETRDEIKDKLAWSTAVWYNKINGITPITKIEKLTIAGIFHDTIENIFNS